MSEPIEERAHKHYSELSSHVRERKTAQLLKECVAELRRLREENERLKAAMREADEMLNFEEDRTIIQNHLHQAQRTPA